MIELRGIRFSHQGRRLDFDVEVSGRAKPYLRGGSPFFVEYDQDVSACPAAIAVIPFLANVLPIGWFGGFRVRVATEVDAAFAASEADLLAAYRGMYPHYRLGPSLDAPRTSRVAWEGDRDLLFFSGGVDSTATLIALKGRDVELLTILGADIALGDEDRWSLRRATLEAHPVTRGHQRHVARTNVKSFYGKAVGSLAVGWWGRVQHGPGSLGIAAPLAWARGAQRLHFASSVLTPWGSTREVDESVRFGPATCFHADAGVSRADKLHRIVAWADAQRADFDLAICIPQEQSCGRCDKCLLTMLLLVSLGVDPRRLGVRMDEDAYEVLFREMTLRRPTQLPMANWPRVREPLARALARGDFFVRADRAREAAALSRIADGEIDRLLGRRRFRLDDATAQAFQFRWPLAYRALWRLFHPLS